MRAKRTAAEVELADTKAGLRRVGILLDQMRDCLTEQGERGSVVRLALHGAAAEEVARLCEP